jgi:uncharacterized protein YjbI with pentapeptide repeats
MANDEHIAILKQGVAAWNAWRRENPDTRPDLSEAKLSGADLPKANLRETILSNANLSGALLIGADLYETNLSGANLSGANLANAHILWANLRGANLEKAHLSNATLTEADLTKANLQGVFSISASLVKANLAEANPFQARLVSANLVGANLSGANLCDAILMGAFLSEANFGGADLKGANLCQATLVDTDFTGADLAGSRIFGISAWRLQLERSKQQNLIITPADEPEITVDNIEVAQFIYLMLHNQKVRDVIDTITSKAVLILGRFTDERKAVLDALREELRKRNYLPILFDFSVPATRDITETISLLARMARFVVADITDAKSIPQELAVIVPDLPSVPVQPLLLEGSAEYGMFEHFKRYPWVLKTYTYPSTERLIADLGERVIGPPEDYARSIL